MSTIRIRGMGTAVPSHTYDQEHVRSVVEGLFTERIEHLDRLLGVFDHLHISQRHFAREPEWYSIERGFSESNEVFIETALDLAKQAASDAIAQAAIPVEHFGGIVIATTTGIMTPSLDAHLIQDLGLPLQVARIPLFGLGCAGGVAGLARAAELSEVSGGSPVLFIAVEICSATFQRNDYSKANIIGTSIFGDGAAAVVLGTGGDGPEIIGSYQQLFPQTYDIMGWEVVDSGFKVRFSRDIPAFIKKNIPEVITAACSAWKIAVDEITSFITHPGGAKVLEAFAEVIGRSPEVLSTSYEILNRYGNMSSATILFVLDAMLRKQRLSPGYGLMSALGPGFSSDQLLLKQS